MTVTKPVMQQKLYSLKHWLEDRDISKATFYKLKKENNAPAITKIRGVNKIFISQEESERWDREAMERFLDGDFIKDHLSKGKHVHVLTPEVKE
tara:strand:+ start:3566 stop:3847 length:282 start_codon:yes stop_codon:yes gene_type:complete